MYFFFARMILGRIQFHRDQVFDDDAGVPLVFSTEGISSTDVQVEAAFVSFVFVTVEIIILEV